MLSLEKHRHSIQHSTARESEMTVVDPCSKLLVDIHIYSALQVSIRETVMLRLKITRPEL